MKIHQIVLLCGLFCAQQLTAQLYEIEQGSIAFVSEAPLEIINAQSDNLNGLINPQTREFAFSIDIRSFYGFNSTLQQVHFNENYMESRIYPQATFAGKIIENIDLSTPGNHNIRVKGQLLIHGVNRERILRGTIQRDEAGDMSIECQFRVLLEEHDIRLPKVVKQKIAESLSITVRAQLKPRVQ